MFKKKKELEEIKENPSLHRLCMDGIIVCFKMSLGMIRLHFRNFSRGAVLKL